MTFRLDARLPVALRAAGLTVYELGHDGVPGRNWLTTARDFSSKPLGQGNHWDAIKNGIEPGVWAKMLQVFKRFGGAATYNGGIFPDGSVWLWAAGRTVNVGKVDSRRVALVRAKKPMPKSRPRKGNVYGNSNFLGWVLQHPGTKPIPSKQLQSLTILNAVCCDLYGFDPITSVTHADLTSRKIDITGLDMATPVAKALAIMRTPKPAPRPAMPAPPAAPRPTGSFTWPLVEAKVSEFEARLISIYKSHVGTPPDAGGKRWWLNELDAAYSTGGPPAVDAVLNQLDQALGKA